MSARHLILERITLDAAAEWIAPMQGWTMGRVAQGTGYLLHRNDARELKSGETFVTAPDTPLLFRASMLGAVQLEFFCVQPQFINGLLTVTENHELKAAAGRVSNLLQLAAGEVISQKFARLAAASCDTLPARTGLLLLWTHAIAGIMAVKSADDSAQTLSQRFQRLIAQMPDAEFATRSLAEITQQLNCSERHFRRLFRKEFGVTLRAHQTGIRLQHARDLLKNSTARISQVAFQSGYHHPGLFNAMFKKHFGMTPREWREHCACNGDLAKNVSSSGNSSLALAK